MVDRKYAEDNQSEYSYTRSLPGSVTKETPSTSSSIDTHLEKQRRKHDKKAERERRKEEKRRMEDAKDHVYDRQIEPMTYDNRAYSVSQSLPDFIPPPPPPPQMNGHATPVYAKSNKVQKEKMSKQQKRKSKREIAVLEGGSVPYGYYDKVGDSQFDFINDETYGGGAV